MFHGNILILDFPMKLLIVRGIKASPWTGEFIQKGKRIFKYSKRNHWWIRALKLTQLQNITLILKLLEH